ncbi:MAG: threonine--tRNA ligase, partial [Candidatus Eremiobacteraeota bacterium]|nr:threonine--tRNA ligase [Candidatus Eremiobacteraeota bacterium]
ALESRSLPYHLDEGGGAFYGPKLDVNVHDAIGRSWQLGTVQLDYYLPQRFGLTYRGSDGKDHTPVMIHRALGGSLERLFGVLIEHYGGAFPAWLAPVQAVIAPISEHQLEYVESVAVQLRAMGFRIEVDASSDKIGYKIRHWKMQKVPYILVAGRQEVADGTVSPNERGLDEKRPAISVEAFAAELADRVRRKV